LFIAVVFTVATYAQVTHVEWGAPFSGKIIRSGFQVLSSDERGLTVLSPNPTMFSLNSVSVLKFDANMNYVSTAKIPLSYQGKDLNFEFMVRLKGHTLVFSSYVDAKAGFKALYYMEYEEATQALTTNTVKVLDMPIVGKPFPSVGTFFYVLSPDSAKMAVVYNPPTSKDGKEKFGCAVLDEDLSLMSTRMDAFPFKDRNFNLESAAVSQEGVVFLNGTLTTGLKNPLKREPNYKYAILMMSPDASAPQEIYVDLDKFFITDLQVGCDINGDLIAAGFYSEKGNFSMKGCLSVKIDGASGEILKSFHKEFPLELITAGMTDKQADRTEDKAEKGQNIEMEKYIMDNLVLRPDNGVYLVAEQYYSVTTYSSSNGSTSSRTTYYGRDIIVVGINENGEIDVTQKVLKKQKSSSQIMVSYVMTLKGSDLYFAFTDSPLNNAPHPPSTQWASYGKSGVTTIACVNSQGGMTRKNLYTFDKNKAIVLPGWSEILKNGSMVLVTRYGTKLRLGLVAIE